MRVTDWERLRKTPEAVELRGAAVAWVSRDGGEVATDVRLMAAAIALATVASRRDIEALRREHADLKSFADWDRKKCPQPVLHQEIVDALNDPEAFARLLHRAEYGESVAMYIEQPSYEEVLDAKMAYYAKLYARALLPALREIDRLRRCVTCGSALLRSARGSCAL